IFNNSQVLQVSCRGEYSCCLVESANNHASVVEALAADPILLYQCYLKAAKGKGDCSCSPCWSSAKNDNHGGDLEDLHTLIHRDSEDLPCRSIHFNDLLAPHLPDRYIYRCNLELDVLFLWFDHFLLVKNGIPFHRLDPHLSGQHID